MTFTFNSDTITQDTLTFSIPDGPQFAYLQLWSQLANQQLQGDIVNKTQAWVTNYAGLLLEKVEGNARYTTYKFFYNQPGGLDDFDIVFTKDVAGVYNYKLFSFLGPFIWNLNNKEWHLETREWNFNDSTDGVLDHGLITIKNVIPYRAPQKVTYASSNETRTGYVYMTNNSI